MSQQGSSVIIMMVVTAMVLLIVMQTWHTTLYSWQEVYMRERHSARCSAMQGLLMCAVALCKNHARTGEDSFNHTIFLPTWPCSDGSNYSGTLYIIKDHKGYSIQGLLIQAEKQVYAMGCRLTSIGKQWVIQEWNAGNG